MQFKIAKGSALFTILQALLVRGQMCEDKAEGWAARHFGQPTKTANEETDLWGGIMAAYVNRKPKPKPKKWRPVQGFPYWFAPFSDQLKAELSKLPTVKHREVNEALGVRNVTGALFDGKSSPALTFDAEYVLAAFPDAVRGYTPAEGMVEILGSEYAELFDNAKMPKT